MAYKRVPNFNARVIVPLAVAAWLGGVIAFGTGVPTAVRVVFIVAFAAAVPLAVFYLMSAGGWRQLARHHRASEPYKGDWAGCATGQMARVGIDHPQFHQVKMRFVGGSLRIASTAEALHLKTIFTGLPFLGWFVPELSIPWRAVKRARGFEAPGWFKPASSPGLPLNVGYDPGYTGRFIELEAGEPTVYVQLPVAMLGEPAERLLAQSAAGAAEAS